MRTIDSSISVLKPSNIAWWHTSWTGRFILAALLIAAAAFVLTPGRTSAQATLQTRCETAAGAANTALVADCVALITAAKSLTEDVGNDINWIGVAEGATLPLLADTDDWDGVILTPVGTAPDQVLRVTAVELPDQGLTGSLSAEWANLTALTSLDLSGNNLSGAIPRSVWVLFDDKITADLMLDGNPMTGAVSCAEPEAVCLR